MKDFYAIPEKELRQTARVMRRLMQERGWRDAKMVEAGAHNLIFATRPDGKAMRFCSCFPGTSTVFACDIADNKLASYEVLKEAGVPQPETLQLSDDETEMCQQLTDFLARHERVVVKPIDGAHGHGVVTGITDVDEAVVAAKDCNIDKKENALVQEQLPDGQVEVRSICIDYKFIAAYERIPAAVTGDGVHMVPDLITIENETMRDEPYYGKMPKIDVEAAEHYLDSIDYDRSYVPAEGEKVRVMSLCNIGMGGSVKEFELSPEKIELSERIAKAVDLPVIGIDFLGDMVIEINAGPALHWPTGDGSEDKCAEAYIEYLERI